LSTEPSSIGWEEHGRQRKEERDEDEDCVDDTSYTIVSTRLDILCHVAMRATTRATVVPQSRELNVTASSL
jgi:hypothetical protein